MELVRKTVLILLVACAVSCSGKTVILPDGGIPPVELTRPFKGPEAAQVTIYEFADFQCSYCSRAVPTLKQLLSEYPNDIKLVFYQYPLSFHENAHVAAEAMLAAQKGGKAWEMHDLMFANQGSLDMESLVAMAGSLGLDTSMFQASLENGTYSGDVDQDRAFGVQLGVKGTPSFLINGVLLAGAQPIDAFRSAVEAAKARAQALLAKGFTVEQLEEEFLREALAGEI